MPSKTTFQDLPIEITHLVLDHLQQSWLLGTLASFRQTSKWTYDISTPYLFKHMIICHDDLINLLAKVTTVESSSSDVSAAPQLRFKDIGENLLHTQHLTLFEASQAHEQVEAPSWIFDNLYHRNQLFPPGNQKNILANVQFLRIQVILGDSNLFLPLLDWISQFCSPKKLCIRWGEDRECREDLGAAYSNPKRIIRLFSNPESKLEVCIHQAEATDEFVLYEQFTDLRISYQGFSGDPVQLMSSHIIDKLWYGAYVFSGSCQILSSLSKDNENDIRLPPRMLSG